MFDHEKMSEKDQRRYAEEMSKAIEADKQAAVDFPPNSGAPLDAERVHDGETWDADTRKWVTHQELGATVTKLKKGWERHFQGGGKRYEYTPGLTVVVLAYDPWVWLEDDENKGDN
jgi:hypothetical protein